MFTGKFLLKIIDKDFLPVKRKKVNNCVNNQLEGADFL